MPISEKEYIEALRVADLRRVDDLRAADQRAVELLAQAQASGTTKSHFNWMAILSVASILVAVLSVVLHRN